MSAERGSRGPLLISASRRTDLPAFHLPWFLARVRAGFCHWVHPYNASVSRISLAPEDVSAIVFWTRHPGALLPHLDELRERYALAFQVTINGYGPPLETHNPPASKAVADLERLADRAGVDGVLWRYDPIVLGGGLDAREHVRRFRALAERLEGVTRRCTFSFVDFYGKTERNLARLEREEGTHFDRPGLEEKRALAQELAGIAARHGIDLRSCCDDSLLGEGVGKSRCVDPEVMEAVRGADLVPAPRAAPTRKDCGCVRSVDVGTYDTCSFGCAYCYAVGRRETARRRLREADPADTLLWRPPSLRGKTLPEAAQPPLVGVPQKN